MFCSPNIVRVIKSRTLRWAGRVVRIEDGRTDFKILTGTHSGKRPLRSLRRGWGEIFEWILKK